MPKPSTQQVRRDIWGVIVAKLRHAVLPDELDQDYIDVAFPEQQKMAQEIERRYLKG